MSMSFTFKELKGRFEVNPRPVSSTPVAENLLQYKLEWFSYLIDLYPL